MPINKPINLEEIRKTINVSSSKNNNLLIFFTIFMLYILISVLGTSDLMLLLPEKTFKMPIINFELNLIAFYILAPIMLLLLHFNNLFNYNMYLKKIDKHSKQINMETLNPSIYGYAYSLQNKGFGGLLLNLFLWFWIYLIPLSILMLIFIRFADYHLQWISNIHIIIVLVDVTLIFLSFHYNKIHVKNTQTSIFLLSFLFRGFIFCIGMAGLLYYFIFFRPMIDEPLDTRIKIEADNHNCKGWVYTILTEGKDDNISTECFPRLVVNEEEMAKISKSALYLPRFLAMEENKKDKNMTKEDKEKKLILDYGTRIDLANRNLRYADLRRCILTRADMHESQLQGATLIDTYLQASNLNGIQLQDAILQGANLQKSELYGAKLQRAVFYKANMQKVSLKESNLTDAKLRGAKLQSAHLERANLRGASFVNANLTKASFNGAKNLTGISFNYADLTGASFNGCDLTDANLAGANLTDASLINTNLTGVNLTGANLTGADLWGTIFNKGDKKIPHPSFKGTRMFGVNISRDKLQDFNLSDNQKRFIIDVNVSKEYLTFHGRRIKYLNKGIEYINKTLKAMPNYKSQEENLTQLQEILKASCKCFKKEETECFKNEKSIYIDDPNKKHKKIYKELLDICKN